MHHPLNRIAHTTAFNVPVVDHWLEQGIFLWVHFLSDNPSPHERMLYNYLFREDVDVDDDDDDDDCGNGD